MDELIFQLQIESESAADAHIDMTRLSGRVVSDSRQVKSGDIFVAVKGPSSDGHDYIANAVAGGAAIVVHQDQLPNIFHGSTHFMRVFNSAGSLGRLAQAALGRPARSLAVYGVTGTNGKTTVASMVRWILDKCNCPCGFIGTIGYDSGKGMVELDNTTPGSVQLAEIMKQMVDNGLKAVAMECSSHGLHQRRTDGIYFNAAAFTNLTGDHLDYHKTMEHYRQAKSELFCQLLPEGSAVINRDDPQWDFFAQTAYGRPLITYGVDRDDVVLAAKVARQDIFGSDLTIVCHGSEYEFHLPVPAIHNVSNFLAAAAMVLTSGIELPDILRAMHGFPGVPGRLSSVNCQQDFAVLVDYAHTDDALDRALATARQLTQNKVIAVFGCGGDRDRTKRPRMAAAAQKYADMIFVTSDNPRTEDPDAIIEEICTGFSDPYDHKVKVITDRKLAIQSAIALAQTGDCVLIAGKGHENYQIIGRQKIHFDDSQVATEAILARAR
ncbi:MAG: UDP-N-acetylmuramoyl-L-alanyl-D-glutamate--2,6-diaminopimelate ligase [Sedimentisphaerales bacterium]|nr:UDP-N-acetylmuramoyl-L-alanyl-D-glutamate--2,6-diaminopimelate ligase [Sedimentisphaerales bacterium]